jgi:hypothetical protein
MNITSTPSFSAGPAPAMAGTAGPSSAPASADADSASAAGNLPSGSGATGAALQTAASYLQVASGYLGRINGVLARMAEMAQAPVGHSAPGAAGQFSTLQQELRGIVGGSSQEIGGPKSNPQAGASFGGSSLFGPTAGITATTGANGVPSVTVAAPNLRQGAIRILIAQNPSGGFALGASDAGAAVTVSEATKEAGGAAASIESARATLNQLSTGAPLDSSDSDSVPASPAAAAAALRAAVGAIVRSPGIAVAAQAPRLTPSLVGLLKTA